MAHLFVNIILFWTTMVVFSDIVNASDLRAAAHKHDHTTGIENSILDDEEWPRSRHKKLANIAQKRFNLLMLYIYGSTDRQHRPLGPFGVKPTTSARYRDLAAFRGPLTPTRHFRPYGGYPTKAPNLRIPTTKATLHRDYFRMRGPLVPARSIRQYGGYPAKVVKLITSKAATHRGSIGIRVPHMPARHVRPHGEYPTTAHAARFTTNKAAPHRYHFGFKGFLKSTWRIRPYDGFSTNETTVGVTPRKAARHRGSFGMTDWSMPARQPRPYGGFPTFAPVLKKTPQKPVNARKENEESEQKTINPTTTVNKTKQEHLFKRLKPYGHVEHQNNMESYRKVNNEMHRFENTTKANPMKYRTKPPERHFKRVLASQKRYGNHGIRLLHKRALHSGSVNGSDGPFWHKPGPVSKGHIHNTARKVHNRTSRHKPIIQLFDKLSQYRSGQVRKSRVTREAKCVDDAITMIGMRINCKYLIERGMWGINTQAEKHCLRDSFTNCCATCKKIGFDKNAPKPKPKPKTPAPPSASKKVTSVNQAHGECSENICKNEGLCFLEKGASQKCACVDYTRESNCEKKMDTCSQICGDVGDCVYYLERTALCICHVPSRFFCRVTSALPTTEEGSDAAESTGKVALIIVSVAIPLVLLICCVQFVRAKSKRRQAREAFKASLERGAIPDNLTPNFMAVFCCGGDNAETEESSSKKTRGKKSATSQKIDGANKEYSEGKKKKKKKKKNKESKKSKSDRKEEKTDNQSANSSRRQMAYDLDEDDDTHAFSQHRNIVHNRNTTQSFTKHSKRIYQNRYNTGRSPRHYTSSTSFPNTKPTDGVLRERSYLRRLSGCMDRRKFNNHEADTFDAC